ASDELLGELLDLTRRLRGQLARHAALGAWAAPGGASARISGADGEAEPEAGSAPGAPDAPPAEHATTAVDAWRASESIAGARARAASPTADETAAAPLSRDPHVGEPRLGDLVSAAAVDEAPSAAHRTGAIAAPRDQASPIAAER